MTDRSADEYTKNLIEGYKSWFWKQSGKTHRKLTLCFWLGLIFGVLATISAAFPKNAISDSTSNTRIIIDWLVVVFTTLSTLFNATLLPRYKTIMKMRDTGRIKLDELMQNHEIQIYTEEERAKIEETIKLIAQIEADHGGNGEVGETAKV